MGKTAVVEGFALRVAAGDVPPPLQNVSLRTLDLGLLQAGAGIKGEFENRLKSVIDEVKSSPRPIILFIDEAHTMIGAGGQAGQGDAANLLKPALARGELRTIAATTWAEYKKYFEKDAALARRFQVVKVEEPTRRRRRRDDARPGRYARKTPQGADPRRGGDRRRAALAPLYFRPPIARQVGQPARYGLRGWRSATRPFRRRSRIAAAASSSWQVAIGILDAREPHRRRSPGSGLRNWPARRTTPRQELAALEARWKKESELVARFAQSAADWKR